MVRAKLTDREWTRIRKIALDRNVPTADLIGNTLRESLLKGAKP
jgi:predicted DNA-binding ribbon-helix-helix protein